MIVRMFAILDKAVEAFNLPFTSRTVPEALRSFSLAVTQDGQFKSNPRDYDLYEIGTFDDTTGIVFTPEGLPRRLISAAEAIAAAADQPQSRTGS